MNLLPVVDHIKTHACFRQVGGAADLAAVGDSQVADPACFVLPLFEQLAEDTEDFDGVSDRLVQFGVLVAVSNRRDARGGAAQDDLESARTDALSALAALVPAGAQVPPRWLRGSLVKSAHGQVWWMDEFEVLLIHS